MEFAGRTAESASGPFSLPQPRIVSLGETDGDWVRLVQPNENEDNIMSETQDDWSICQSFQTVDDCFLGFLTLIAAVRVGEQAAGSRILILS
jgi:hypothetical protein